MSTPCRPHDGQQNPPLPRRRIFLRAIAGTRLLCHRLGLPDRRQLVVRVEFIGRNKLSYLDEPKWENDVFWTLVPFFAAASIPRQPEGIISVAIEGLNRCVGVAFSGDRRHGGFYHHQ